VVRRRRFALLTGLAALAVTACGAILGIEDHAFRYEDVEAGAEAAAPEVPDPCQHARPPGPPIGDDSPDRRFYVFALENLDVTGRIAGAVVGFDIDGVCTCDTRKGTARDGGTACVAPKDSVPVGSCDFDGGIDSAFAAIVDEAKVYGDITGLLSGANDNVICGSYTMLIALSGYNGQLDDPEVRIAFLQSRGIASPHADGEKTPVPVRCQWAPDAGRPFPAKFDGTDEWSVPRGSINPTFNFPTEGTLPAYVTGGKLVVDGKRLPKGTTIPVALGTRATPLSTPSMIGDLVALDEARTTFRLDHVVLTGRVSVDGILTSLGSVRTRFGATPADDEFLCAGREKPFYDALKLLACRAPDLMVNEDRDFTAAACDALSFTAVFNASPAKLGVEVDPVQDDRPCGTGFSDSCGP
jgi:hypothetical protein